MAVTGMRVNRADDLHVITAGAPITRQQAVSLTATNYIAQYAGGAAIADTTGPWTEFTPTRLPQIVLGAGGANPTVYTITGTDIYTGAALVETVTAAGAGTYKSTVPFATITAFSSDIDPIGTTDLQAGDTWVYPASRNLHIGVAGAVACRLMEDSADATLPGLAAGDTWRRVKIVRITATAATDLVLGW